MVEERINPPEEEPLPAPEPVKDEEEQEDLSDLFEVPRSSFEKEDMSDLIEVSEEDVMGEDEENVLGEDEEAEEESKEELEPEPEPEPVKVEPHWSDGDLKRFEESKRPRIVRKPVIRRTTKPYTPPDRISGMR